ncbi:hypothetical protein EV356DRAFT_505120 [Viridothelium virens]|uniref:Uncharacterized protein n=1 Tax=Viridothelium virens TaxID=1048519 RepID=A0A6A6H3X4_VIRVR|nr:hypothetical protein EV356DRAFT_505120 [Viridothelium virens]
MLLVTRRIGRHVSDQGIGRKRREKAQSVLSLPCLAGWQTVGAGVMEFRSKFQTANGKKANISGIPGERRY